MTVTLVTGGNGFIGRYVVDKLHSQQREVIVLDRHVHPWDYPTPHCEFYYGDIRDSTHVAEAMAHADSWIHLAGVLGTQETIDDPRPAVETNITGGLNVLEAAARYKLPGVNIAVGNYWMNNPYSITKNTVERFAQMYNYHRGTQVTNVRVMNAYGPGQSVAAPFGPSKVRKITPSFICRLLTGLPIEIYGDGLQVMDMIHVRDVADILVAALLHTEQNGAVRAARRNDRLDWGSMEAGTGRRTTVAQIAKAAIKAVHGNPDLDGTAPVDLDDWVRYLPMRPGEPEHAAVYADPHTLDAIGYDWSQLTLLEDGLVETAQWFREVWQPAYAEQRQQLTSQIQGA
jgi:UDP-glucose 4-epimerase